MARGQRKPSTREEVEETQATILRTAERLFMEYGYRAVSTRQIADACGLTQPALYHHFADKQALYTAVIQEALAKTKAALERIARRNESVQVRLQYVASYLLSHTQQDMPMMLHDIRQELDSATQTKLHELFLHGLILPIASILEDGFQSGLFHDQHGLNAVAVAYLFMNMISSFLGHSATGATKMRPLTQTERAEIVVHLLLHGLATDSSSASQPD